MSFRQSSPTEHNDMSHSSHHNASNSQANTRRGLFSAFKCGINPSVFESVVDNRLWKTFAVFFTVVMLFGTQVQHLIPNNDVDRFFEVLFIVTFAFFMIDILLRLLCKPSYFQCSIRGRGYTGDGNGAPFIIGSYIFWCDVISTMMILFDISYVNSRHFETPEINIVLAANGSPLSGFDRSTRFQPVELEQDLLITIFRTLRVARFVRSHTVVKRSSKIDWLWLFHNSYVLNPAWYYYNRRSQRQNQDSADFGTETTSEGTGGDSARMRERRPSWGMLQVSVLSTIRAQKEMKREASRSFGLVTAFKAPFRALGILRNEKIKVKRHIAATKLQRAYRAHARRLRTSNGGGVSYDEDWQISSWDVQAQTNANEDSKESTSSGRSKNESPPNNASARPGAAPLRESQIGSDMRDLTGQRVAIGIVLALVFTVLFTYSEVESSRLTTMVVLHRQTKFAQFKTQSLDNARSTSIPDLFQYQFADNSIAEYAITEKGSSIDELRDREKLQITVTDASMQQTVGYFSFRTERVQSAFVELVATAFVLLLWFLGVTAFAGPVMSLVVTPIERMVRLLGMLMIDPLGYQSTSRFKRFLAEEEALIKNTRWTKDVLKGMETSFLMSTILRIGSLMKVGFGSAGVEIIRNNLQKGHHTKQMLNLTEQGSTVSCIFLFCDIRQFTDATECLQEEVFVFTNRIAAVVHSFCHAFGGSANKNVGDAFLVSWMLDDDKSDGGGRFGMSSDGDGFKAKSYQADKALFSVIKICISLHHDKYYMEAMTEAARERLLSKLAKRSGPVVQMGFGLHAGKAVQGAIGSQRKIDATYVSEAVERSEFLESSTKQYGVNMLMSDSFHRLLHPTTRQKCRKVDKVLLVDDEQADDEHGELSGERMDLITFDMDIDALFRSPYRRAGAGSDVHSESDSLRDGSVSLRSRSRRPQTLNRVMRRRRSLIQRSNPSEELGSNTAEGASGGGHNHHAGVSVSSNISETAEYFNPPELKLPKGPTLYSLNVWHRPDMKRIRDRYIHGLFYQKFDQGLQAYYDKDWESATQCFQHILDIFEDGPSRYFMGQIKKHNGVPPRDFRPYSIA